MRITRRLRIGALLALTALLGVPAGAAPITFAFDLGPEVTGATGSGSATATYDDVARTLAIAASWSGLSGGTTVAHIHCCVASPGTVGVAVTPDTLPLFPVGLNAGSYSTTLDLALSSTYTPTFRTNFGGGTVAGAEAALLVGLRAGTAYFNIHSTAFRGGEIRGFATVPEPSSFALLALGLGALGWMRRRPGALAAR
jgi:hypothetical protein